VPLIPRCDRHLTGSTLEVFHTHKSAPFCEMATGPDVTYGVTERSASQEPLALHVDSQFGVRSKVLVPATPNSLLRLLASPPEETSATRLSHYGAEHIRFPFHGAIRISGGRRKVYLTDPLCCKASCYVSFVARLKTPVHLSVCRKAESSSGLTLGDTLDVALYEKGRLCRWGREMRRHSLVGQGPDETE